MRDPAVRRSAAAPRRWSSRGRVPASQHDAMRAPFQDGDFPGPVKYGYLNVGVVEDGPPELLGRTVFCLHPHQTAYVVPGDRGDRRAGRRAGRPGGARRHRRDRRQRAVGRRRRCVGDRVAVVGAGHGRLLRRPAARPDPRRRGDARRRRPGAGRRRRRARRRTSPCPTRRRRRARPGRAHQRDLGRACSARWTCSAPEGTVVELSWYGDDATSALPRRRLPLGPADRPGQPGRHGGPGPARASYDRRTGCALALELLRDPAFDCLLTGESPFEELPDVMPRLASRRAAGAVPRGHLRRRRGGAVFSVTVRDHMMVAHSLRGRGLRTGPAAARRDLRRRRDVPRRAPRRRRDPGRHRPGRPSELRARGGAS